MSAAAIVILLVQCGGRYRPLDVAESCACKPSEYCSVTPPGRIACHPLPQACGARPTCDCIGDRTDACRDEDGRLTLLPTRVVASCDACSSQEYCNEGADGPSCRVLPPECAETPTCACFLGTRGRSARFTCSDRAGRIVARAQKQM